MIPVSHNLAGLVAINGIPLAHPSAALAAMLARRHRSCRLPDRRYRRRGTLRRGDRRRPGQRTQHRVADRGHPRQSERPHRLQCARFGIRPRRPVPEALRDFNRAIELNPRYFEAYANRALIYRFTGDLGRAHRRLQPRHPDQSALRRRLLSAAARCIAAPAAPPKPSTISRRRSSSTPRIRAPITAAA